VIGICDNAGDLRKGLHLEANRKLRLVWKTTGGIRYTLIVAAKTDTFVKERRGHFPKRERAGGRGESDHSSPA